jgi:hypothetical protein
MAMHPACHRRKRISWLCLVGLLLLLGQVPECISDPYRRAQPTENEREELLVFHRLSPEQRLPALRALSPEKQARWITLLRDYDPASPWYTQSDRRELFRQLLALNDRETAQWMIRDYTKLESGNYDLLHALSEWHVPDGIAFIASQALSNEPYIQQGSDGPISFSAATILLEKMLPNVEALPFPVRQWARNSGPSRMGAAKEIWRAGGDSTESHKLASNYVNYREREIAQLWWRANEKAILAGQWQDVRPGEDFDTPKFRAILAQLGAPKTVGASEPKGTASDTLIVTAGSPAPFSGQSYRWIAVGILAALLATVARWLVLHSKSKKR